MRVRNGFFSAATLATIAALSLPDAVAHRDMTKLCSVSDFDATVAQYYLDNPGSPPAIPARRLVTSALTLMDALEATGAAKVMPSNPERLSALWATIDAWGEDTQMHLVFPLENKHVIDVITEVPITQPDDGSGFLDIYADDGDGVHGHVYVDKVAAIAVATLPGDGDVTRVVSFFDVHGDTIFSAYASQSRKTADPKAESGFEGTWGFAQAQDSLCR